MMKPVLEIKNISKKFRIYHENRPYLSIRDSFSTLLKPASTEDFWALQDISFNITPGESVGIIGKNGAGKSTLLKILSRITPPTSGSIISRGRIASLLEVGTGFHLELNGRENIFLNGAILGMKRKHIQQKFDEIVDFSGVEQFIDTPLKHYSSGMQLRLAFAVAAFLESEIIIIDEVLAVGDAEFQKKCMGKMEDISQQQGRTVLFVSHNITAINSLCSKCLYLKKGKVFSSGETSVVVNKYLTDENVFSSEKKWEGADMPGDTIASLHSVKLIDEQLNKVEVARIDNKIGIQFVYEVKKPGHRPMPNVHIFTTMGQCVFFSIEKESATLEQVGMFRSVIWIPENMLNVGQYIVGVALSTLSPLIIHFYEKEALIFDTIEDLNKRHTGFKDPIPGVVRPSLNWDTIRIG